MNSKERKKNVRHKTLPKIIRKEEGVKNEKYDRLWKSKILG